MALYICEYADKKCDPICTHRKLHEKEIWCNSGGCGCKGKTSVKCIAMEDFLKEEDFDI